MHERNLEEVVSLIQEVRKCFPEKDIWIYSGYTYQYLKESKKPEDILRRQIVESCDVFCELTKHILGENPLPLMSEGQGLNRQNRFFKQFTAPQGKAVHTLSAAASDIPGHQPP